MSNKRNTIVTNIAFYAILLFCLAGVGAGAYLILFPGSAEPQQPEQPQLTGRQETETPLTEVIQPVTIPVTPEVTDPDPVDITPIEPVQPEPPVTESTPIVSVIEEPKPVVVPEPEPVQPAAAVLPDPVVMPLDGEIVTAFSMDTLVYNATLADWRTHDGIDISADAGTGVLAAAAGTVADVREDGLLGITVVLQHSDGCRTTYASLAPELSVKFGQRVDAGQLIGAVGTSAAGEAASGPHLHFSVSQNGIAVDPTEYLAS
ncbi:MAG: hypothetical protein E7445_07315 [Ruminococcaceae bacterium]|nr:hypothetical protein [Oscillospiraceae bacterium]